MSQNLIATKFQLEVFTSTVKSCFDALKHYKQRKLLSKTEENLANEGDNIADLNLILRDMIDSRDILTTQRAFNSVKTAL
jgi:hypothetical protein